MNFMEKNWKLCETLIVGVIGTSEIHLADSSKKTYEKEIDKLIKKEGGKKFVIENNGFSVRLCGVNLMISHPELPEEYSLQNQTSLDDIMRIISLTKTDNGVFEGNNWSFLMDSYKNFLPAKEGIQVYDEAEIKMIRNFSLLSSTKTSKWVPGYSYFSEDTTYHYLGIVSSWRDRKNVSTTNYGPQKIEEPLYMVLSSNEFNPKKGQTYNLTSVIKENFSKIQFLRTRKTMVKSQTAFAKDDFVNYVPLIEDLLDKWIKDNKSTYNCYSNLVTYSQGIEKFFNILEVSVPGEQITLTDRSIKLIESVVEDCMKFELIKRFNSKEHLGLEESKFKNLPKIFFFDSIGGDVYNQQSYYGNILLNFGINLDEIAERVLLNFDVQKLMDTWEHYLNNLINVSNNPGELTEFFLDESFEKIKTYNYYGAPSIKTGFTTQERPVFENIMDFCRETSKNVSEYMVRNAGTISKPRYIEVFTITIDTIHRMYGNDVPEDVQEVLIKGKFKKVTIKKDLK